MGCVYFADVLCAFWTKFYTFAGCKGLEHNVYIRSSGTICSCNHFRLLPKFAEVVAGVRYFARLDWKCKVSSGVALFGSEQHMLVQNIQHI